MCVQLKALCLHLNLCCALETAIADSMPGNWTAGQAAKQTIEPMSNQPLDTYYPSTIMAPTTMVTSALQTILVIGNDDMLQHCLQPSADHFRLINVRTARAALTFVGHPSLSAVLINVTALGCDAYTTCTLLRNKSTVPIIMVSTNKRTEELVAGIEAGADHYLVMPFTIEEMRARVQATQRRSHYQSPAEYCIGQDEIILNLVKQEVRIHETVIELTTNECRLLQHLVRNPNRAIRTEDLLQVVWGYGPADDVSIVRTTIHRLRNKIEKNPSAPKYLKTIFGLGYRFCTKP